MAAWGASWSGSFYLIQQGVLREPLLYLSAYLERHRDEYVDRLQTVREQGDYESWVTFFLGAIAVQGRNAIRSGESLLRLNAEFRERLRRIRARGQSIDAAERLIGNPYVSAPRLAGLLGVTRQGAQYIISTLTRAGILSPVATEARPALYVAREVPRRVVEG